MGAQSRKDPKHSLCPISRWLLRTNAYSSLVRLQLEGNQGHGCPRIDFPESTCKLEGSQAQLCRFCSRYVSCGRQDQSRHRDFQELLCQFNHLNLGQVVTREEVAAREVCGVHWPDWWRELHGLLNGLWCIVRGIFSLTASNARVPFEVALWNFEAVVEQEEARKTEGRILH